MNEWRRRPGRAEAASFAIVALLASGGGCGPPNGPTPAAISEFSLGIVPLNGSGYRVTFRSGGAATDVRSGDLIPDAECVGSVPPADYERVAGVMAEEGFFSLEGPYGSHPEEPPTVFTMATRDGTQKTVRNHRGAAPSSLRRIQAAIRELRESVAWAARSGQPGDQRRCSTGFFYGEPR